MVMAMMVHPEIQEDCARDFRTVSGVRTRYPTKASRWVPDVESPRFAAPPENALREGLIGARLEQRAVGGGGDL